MGKVTLKNKMNEGILGVNDPVVVTPNRGFADRSIGDEFYRTGRNTGTNRIESNDGEIDLEDAGYDYDGGEPQGDDEAYSQHVDMRTQLYRMNSRLETIEGLMTDLTNMFGSRGTAHYPLNMEVPMGTEYEDDMVDSELE